MKSIFVFTFIFSAKNTKVTDMRQPYRNYCFVRSPCMSSEQKLIKLILTKKKYKFLYLLLHEVTAIELGIH